MFHKIYLKIEIYLIFIAIFFAVFILALEILNLNNAIYGLRLGNEKIGGLNKSEVEQVVINKIEKLNSIKIQTKTETWTAEAKELGIKIDKNKTINYILKTGKDKNILLGIKTQLSSLFFKKQAKLITSLDEDKFEDYFSKYIEKINYPAEDAKISYTKNDTITIIPEKYGIEVDKNKLKNDLLKSISNLNNKPIEISFTTSYPNTTTKEIEKFKNDIYDILLSSPYILSLDNKKIWEIDKDTLKELLITQTINSETKLVLDKEKLKNILIQASPSINREPKNAILTFKNKKVSEFKISEDGIKLDLEKSLVKIEKEILNKNKEINLIIQTIPAEIRTETIDNLGIITKISSGVSDFSGSPLSRIHNIKLGAEKINGTIIKPGEEFSFVKALGKISKSEGYKASYVIKNGKTIPEYGGGLCQVSTTTFRAAIYAGLKITERFPHSYPVKYYDPQGFDAAIYGPHPDLRFVNDTPANILVQAYTKGTKLYFDFYGTPDGRSVKLIGPIVYDSKPDGSLKTKLTREIYDKEGELLKSKTFWSSYKSKDLYPIIKNPLE